MVRCDEPPSIVYDPAYGTPLNPLKCADNIINTKKHGTNQEKTVPIKVNQESLRRKIYVYMISGNIVILHAHNDLGLKS